MSVTPDECPRDAGFRRLPEWAPHAAVWVAWPRLPEEWLGDLEPPRRAIAALCRAIAEDGGETVEMLVYDRAGEASARAALADLGDAVRFRRIPYGDVWLRDTGPLFVAGDDRLGAVDFGFDGWGRKYLFEHDPEVAERIARATGARRFARAIVFEGGAVDVDGAGRALTTRQCALDRIRNPGATEADIERELAETLGATDVVWLERGLANDHTDGHVDTLARFVRPGVAVCMEARDADDPNREVVDEIARALAAARVEVVRVPSPGRIDDHEDKPLPASYVNFYVGNRAVVIPTYGSPYDDEAVETIAALFPDRRGVGVDARALVLGGGALHCVTHEQPAPRDGAAP